MLDGEAFCEILRLALHVQHSCECAGLFGSGHRELIYEMRFDEASARYAEFGPFYTGLQFSPAELPKLLAGQVPALLGA